MKFDVTLIEGPYFCTCAQYIRVQNTTCHPVSTLKRKIRSLSQKGAKLGAHEIHSSGSHSCKTKPWWWWSFWFSPLILFSKSLSCTWKQKKSSSTNLVWINGVRKQKSKYTSKQCQLLFFVFVLQLAWEGAAWSYFFKLVIIAYIWVNIHNEQEGGVKIMNIPIEIYI